jgi:thioredoxin 1
MTDAVIDTTDQAFDEQVLGSPTPVLVDFWADWCVPCHMVSPIVEEIGREKGEALRVMKLNVDENPSTAQRFGVMGIPTLILFKDGEEKARVVGAKGKEAILAEIGSHIAA